MTQLYRYFVVERHTDVFCVRLRSHQLLETEIHALAQELVVLARTPGCRGVALALGPKPPECLYSVFLAKLYWVQRLLDKEGVQLTLCEADPMVRSVFEACKLEDQFHFVKDFDEALVRLERARRVSPQNPPRNGHQA